MLQRVACRYRGVGSPFAARYTPCTAEELTTYYEKITKEPRPPSAPGGTRTPSFVDPYARPLDSKGAPILGSAWSQRVWNKLQQDERKSQKRRPPIPSVPPPVDAFKTVNGRRVRPSVKEQLEAATRMAAQRIILDTPVPPVSHTLWLAAPDSDEFMVCCSVFMAVSLLS